MSIDKKTKLNNIVREKVRQRIKKKKEKKNVCEKNGTLH